MEYKDKLTFSEALEHLTNKGYTLMRYKDPSTDYEGPFFCIHYGLLCNHVGFEKYVTVDMNLFSCKQLSECAWYVSKPNPVPPKGWFKAVNETWYKPVIVDVWINVWYNYGANVERKQYYWSEEEAKLCTSHIDDNYKFIKTRHVSQQLSIPWVNPNES